jgi:hypothetical protein
MGYIKEGHGVSSTGQCPVEVSPCPSDFKYTLFPSTCQFSAHYFGLVLLYSVKRRRNNRQSLLNKVLITKNKLKLYWSRLIARLSGSAHALHFSTHMEIPKTNKSANR